MTGSNKYVLSIYSRWMTGQQLNKSRLDLTLQQCQDHLSNQDIRQLINTGVPVAYLKLQTKQEVLDHILNEVKEFIPIARNLNFRQSTKAINRLRKAMIKSIKI